MADYIISIGKAVTGALIGFLGSLATVLVGDATFDDITAGQWVAAVIVGLVALAGIWSIPWKPIKS